ncbi:MAG: hypothetical protein WKF65_10225 [Gaiellaceae bacterium]
MSDGKLRGRTDSGQNPTWLASARPVVFAPYVYHSADAWLVNLANPNDPTQWFQDRATVNVLDPSDGEPLNDGEVTRARDKIAVVRGPSTTASSAETMIRIYGISSLTARPLSVATSARDRTAGSRVPHGRRTASASRGARPAASGSARSRPEPATAAPRRSG